MKKSELSFEQRAGVLCMFDTCYNDIVDSTLAVRKLTDRGSSAVQPASLVAANAAAYSFGLSLFRKLGLNVVRCEGVHQFV